MGAKLVRSSLDGTIPVYEMKKGQVGVITTFETSPEHVGKLVIATDSLAQGIGIPIHWMKDRSESFRVRILTRGEQIEIT